jgi:hypothetical protein
MPDDVSFKRSAGRSANSSGSDGRAIFFQACGPVGIECLAESPGHFRALVYETELIFLARSDDLPAATKGCANMPLSSSRSLTPPPCRSRQRRRRGALSRSVRRRRKASVCPSRPFDQRREPGPYRGANTVRSPPPRFGVFLKFLKYSPPPTIRLLRQLVDAMAQIVATGGTLNPTADST